MVWKNKLDQQLCCIRLHYILRVYITISYILTLQLAISTYFELFNIFSSMNEKKNVQSSQTDKLSIVDKIKYHYYPGKQIGSIAPSPGQSPLLIFILILSKSNFTLKRTLRFTMGSRRIALF